MTTTEGRAFVQPTLFSRELVYDALRGFAILGIFLANVWAMGFPWMEELFDTDQFDSPAGRAISSLTSAFVSGKFRSTLAILFGIGLWLQYQKRKDVPGGWPGGYFKRTFFLLLIGLFHGIFLFWGDILALYAAVSFVAAIMVTAAPIVQYRFIWGGLILTAILGLLIAAAVTSMESQGGMSWSPVSAERLISAYGSGTLANQIEMNMTLYGVNLQQAAFSLPMLGPLFLIGFWMARTKALTDPGWHRPEFRRLVVIALAVGVPANLAALAFVSQGVPLSYYYLIEFLFAPFLAVGYMAAVAMVCKWRPSASIVRMLSKVGRVALSVYLMQSLLGCVIFNSWGLGLYNQLQPLQTYWVVLAVWTINITFAILWLRRYAMGPVEWLWRSAAEGRRAPLTIREAEAAKRLAPSAVSMPKTDPVRFEL